MSANGGAGTGGDCHRGRDGEGDAARQDDTGDAARRDDSRRRILSRVARATARRPKTPHPGSLETPEPTGGPDAAFAARFVASGGEVAAPDPGRSLGDWLTEFMAGSGLGLEIEGPTVAVGAEVPPELRPDLDAAPPDRADAGVCRAWAAVAETGSLVLESTGGRAVQVLPPVLVVWVPAGRVYGRLEDALVELAEDLPAAVGLHSGPSKSADIGRTVVTGVHGPGRCVAVPEAADGWGPQGSS